MTNKWERTKETFSRAHSDLFDTTAEFFNYDSPGDGDYDPDTGKINYSGRSSEATVDCEIVPPTIDSTVETDGTSLSFDTSIRFPDSESITTTFKPIGDGFERPTEVEIADPHTGSDTVYELHGYSYEKNSGMIMCRLVEQ